MKKMYNEESKMSFLNTLMTTSSKAKAKTVFYASCNMETKLNKDVSMFTKSELIRLFESNDWSNRDFFNAYKNALLKYDNYLIQNNNAQSAAIENLINLKYADVNCVENYRNKYYKTFDELVETLNKIFDSETDYILLRMKCICGLLWYGVPKEDIMCLTLDNIDKSKNLIRCTSVKKRVSVPKYVIDWCNILGSTNAYSNAIGKIYALEGGNKIIKTRQMDFDKLESETGSLRPLTGITTNFNFTADQKLQALSEDKRKEINFKKLVLETLEKNGRFARAYEIEENSSAFKNTGEYNEAMKCEKHFTNVKIEFDHYCNWKKAYNL